MKKTGKCAWGLLVVLTLAGCSAVSISSRPDNRVIRAASFEVRMKKWNQTQTNQINADENVLWMKRFCGELKDMDAWAPPPGWFTNSATLSSNISNVLASTGYPASLTNGVTTNDVRAASGYFFLSESADEPGLTNFVSTNASVTNFISAAGVPAPPSGDKLPLSGKLNLLRLAADMLLRIDDEHQTLLVNHLCPGKYSERGPSPRMVSRVYPVGVSLAVVNPPETQKSSEQTNSQPLVTINNYPGGKPPAQDNVKTNSQNEPTNSAAPEVDFDPVQNVTLSLSTVLNSADVLDRIEYVSTFIYVYPYPQQPNADVSIDDEFWKWFSLYQLPRPAETRTNAVVADLGRSYDSMRVRFRNITTTVLTKDLNLGSVTRGIENSLSATVGATIPVAPAAVSPSVSASSKDTSSTTMQILKQLDQRSAYVSSDGTFVRITQRGMSSVNLNGRFNEQVQLYIPRAREPFYVIEPTTTNTTKFGIQLKTITEPLYSRVDAVVVSVVVVRHPTELRRTDWETFGLSQEDAADEDFIVGLARPAKVQLWNWPRNVNIIYTSDLDFTATKTTNNVQIYFDSPATGLYEAERLELASFADPQTLAFLGKITRAIRTGFDTNCLQTLENFETSFEQPQNLQRRSGNELLYLRNRHKYRNHDPAWTEK